MDLELARDLDITLDAICRKPRIFPRLEGMHGEHGCITREHLHSFLAKHISEAHRSDWGYMDHLVRKLHANNLIARSYTQDDHVQPMEEGRIFLKQGGFEYEVRSKQLEAERSEQERSAALAANKAVVDTLELSKSEARRSGRYAILSGLGFLLSLAVAIFSALVEPLYDPKQSDSIRHDSAFGNKTLPKQSISPEDEQQDRSTLNLNKFVRDSISASSRENK